MIYIAGDKHGWQAISIVIEYLDGHGIAYENIGVTNKDDDMPLEVMLPPVATRVKSGTENSAIVSCGTGIGIEVGINKFSGIRAALATNPQLAEWAKEKDKCNVLCLVGWQASKESVYAILDAWFASEYDGSQKRLAMMDAFDTWH